MKTRKIIILLFAIVLGYTSNAQTKYEKAQQGINTLISIKESIVGGPYPTVKLCDLTILSSGVKISSVKIESPDHSGYIDKPELSGLVSGLKKMKKLLEDNPDNNTEYVYRLTGGLSFYSRDAKYIYIFFGDGSHEKHYMDDVIKYLEAAKNGTPIKNE